MRLRTTAFYLSTALLILLSATAQEHPTYQVGPQADGSFVTPTNQVVTPPERKSISTDGQWPLL